MDYTESQFFNLRKSISFVFKLLKVKIKVNSFEKEWKFPISYNWKQRDGQIVVCFH